MKKLISLLFILPMFLFLALPAQANILPMLPSFKESPKFYFILILLVSVPVWIFNSVVESIFFYLFIKAKEKQPIFNNVFIANAITVFPTLMINFVIGETQAQKCLIQLARFPYKCLYLSQLIAEIIPFAGEILLYLWLFNRHGELNKINQSQIILITIAANIVTFAAGLFVFPL